MSLPITEELQVDGKVTKKTPSKVNPNELVSIAIKNRPEVKQGSMMIEILVTLLNIILINYFQILILRRH